MVVFLLVSKDFIPVGSKKISFGTQTAHYCRRSTGIRCPFCWIVENSGTGRHVFWQNQCSKAISEKLQKETYIITPVAYMKWLRPADFLFPSAPLCLEVVGSFLAEPGQSCLDRPGQDKCRQDDSAGGCSGRGFLVNTRPGITQGTITDIWWEKILANAHRCITAC